MGKWNFSPPDEILVRRRFFKKGGKRENGKMEFFTSGRNFGSPAFFKKKAVNGKMGKMEIFTSGRNFGPPAIF
jgi:hypothetical protein